MSQKNFASYGDMETLIAEIADKCGPYTEISYEDWLQLTPYQQEHGRWDVTGVPGADGTISIDLMTKLWENPDPTAEFAEQDITGLNISAYDMLAISTSDGVSFFATAKRGRYTYVTSSGNIYTAFSRLFTPSPNNNKITITDCTGAKLTDGTTTTGNDRIIPITIYGIKLHHTVEIKAIAPEVSTLAENCVFDPTGTDLESTDVEAAIKELESNFQDGVDAVYDAVVAKGSTPASHSLSDVVDGIAAIPTGITPSGTINITANGNSQDVSSYQYANVNVPNSNSGTYTASSRSSALDMGAANTYRYVNTNSVPNSNSATYTTTTRENKDLGAANTYRYVNTSNMPNSNSATYTATTRTAKIDLGAANTYRYLVTSGVPNSNSTTYTYGSGSTGGKVDLGATNSYRYVVATNAYNQGKKDLSITKNYIYDIGADNAFQYLLKFTVKVSNGALTVTPGITANYYWGSINASLYSGWTPFYGYNLSWNRITETS